jgi:hypothetical protein
MRRSREAFDEAPAPALSAESGMSWTEIVKEARTTEEQWRAEGSIAWYRGHADATWELKSTLHREVESFFNVLAKKLPASDELDVLHNTYKEEYRSFRSNAWPLLDQRERSDWGIVFAMQHYGQVTRLLDWSVSFACAVYFALFQTCEKCHVTSQEAAIWMLDPQALNKESQGVEVQIALEDAGELAKADGTVLDVRSWHPKYKDAVPNNDLKSIAIAPDFTNPRMTAQKAAFTMAGDSFNPLDQEFPQLMSAKRLRKFVLTPTAKDDAATFLAAAGLDAYSFFPDLHGLALRHKDEVRKRFERLTKFYRYALKKT